MPIVISSAIFDKQYLATLNGFSYVCLSRYLGNTKPSLEDVSLANLRAVREVLQSRTRPNECIA